MNLEKICCPNCGSENFALDEDEEREYYDSDGPTTVYCNTNVCIKCGTRYHVIEVEVPTVVERCVYEEDVSDEEMMQAVKALEIPIEEDGIISYYLKMNPSSEWLGRDGLKYLQVRCTYVDNSSDTLKNVTIKSNTFYGIVNLGLYP